MFSMSMLPDLTPRDPHSLFYTPRQTPWYLLDPTNQHHSTPTASDGAGAGAANPLHTRDRDARRLLVERTALARMQHDENLMERRRLNAANFGCAWLKPPGVPKTLLQMREERREAEEHAEALRREQMVQQLAEAEMEEGVGTELDDDDDDAPMMEGEGQGEELVDLDGEIPEAEGFGFDGEESDEETEEEEDGDEDEDSEESGDAAGEVFVSPAEQDIRDIRAAEDRLREMLARSQEDGSEAGDDLDDEQTRAEILEEEDLMQQVRSVATHVDESMGMDMDMDADLDEEIPEADDRYEHTDSEDEMSDDGTREVSFTIASSARPLRIRRSTARSSLRSNQRSSVAQSDVDISGLLSIDGSSFIGESPYMRPRRS